VLKKGKEHIILRKASKNYVCHECGKPIFKGDLYIEDCINYVTKTRYDKVFLKWYHNKICLKSWKGPLPTNAAISTEVSK
jgi:hypothetical protein